MKTGKKLTTLSFGVFILFSILFSQNSGYLSQKLMVENNIRDRVKDALSKIIDSHKYVINVDVELEVLDEVNEQITVFSPREKNKKEVESPAEKTASVLQRMQQNVLKEEADIQKESYSIGLPIPGFEVDVSQQKSEQRSITQSNPISSKTMEPIQNSLSSEDNDTNRELVDKVVSRKRPSRAEVKRMDIALILQEGAAPELIENIRQLTMASSKFDRNRGDKITIMTASFKERRDQKSAEQIMLKNIAEKIENLEQKRIVESGSWREDIEKYKTEQSLRREQDLASLENAMAELEKKRVEDAAEYEKKELMRRDSIRNSKLESEIKALKEMLTLDKNNQGESKLDSSRFAMLDNELQSLQKTLFQAMSQDSSDAARRAQAKIESEIALREEEKKSQDSLIQEKLLALDAAQAELVVFQEEAKAESGSSQMILYILSGVSALLLVALIIILLKNKKTGTSVPAPMPPWMMYPPPRPPRRKKRKRRPPVKQQEKKEQQENQEVKNIELEQARLEINNNQNSTEQVNPHKLTDDPNVLKSEIDDIRKSVVSMSVGQPGKTSTIVQEWLEQPAPAPVEEAEPKESSNDEESNDEESDDE
jgi:flagellar biosynthesis/type III secretory pathway M-ring protein FliF/YscJ